jgi:hypothetical protein
VHPAAQARVGRAVEVQHRALAVRDGRVIAPVGPDRGLHLAREVLAEARIAEHRRDVAVAREQPHAERALVDRRQLAEPVVEGIRIGAALARLEEAQRDRIGAFVGDLGRGGFLRQAVSRPYPRRRRSASSS